MGKSIFTRKAFPLREIRILLFLFVLVFGCEGVGIALGAWAPIDNVSITPRTPTSVDPITINVSGEIGSSNCHIGNHNFFQNNTLQELDLFFYSTGIGLSVVGPWNYSEAIGTLPAGIYSLKVRTYQDSMSADTYTTSYFVVPEPSTLVLFSVGVFCILAQVLYRRNIST